MCEMSAGHVTMYEVLAIKSDRNKGAETLPRVVFFVAASLTSTFPVSSRLQRTCEYPRGAGDHRKETDKTRHRQPQQCPRK